MGKRCDCKYPDAQECADISNFDAEVDDEIGPCECECHEIAATPTHEPA